MTTSQECTMCGVEKPLISFTTFSRHARNNGKTCRACLERVRTTPMPDDKREKYAGIVGYDMSKVAQRAAHSRVMVYLIHRDHGFVHLSGEGYTTDKNHAWFGMPNKINALCAKYGHDRKALRSTKARQYVPEHKIE